MSEIVEFLDARIAEDEQAAERMRENENWVSDCNESHNSKIEIHDLGWTFDADHLLAQCRAKRRILERTGALAAHLIATGRTMPDRYSAELIDGILADLAHPYANHSSFREEWRP